MIKILTEINTLILIYSHTELDNIFYLKYKKSTSLQYMQLMLLLQIRNMKNTVLSSNSKSRLLKLQQLKYTHQ